MKFLEEDEEELKGFRKWLYGMKLRWTHGIIPSIYDIKWGIKNLIKWFPHIWKSQRKKLKLLNYLKKVV